MWYQKPPLGTPLDWGNPYNKDLVLHLGMQEGHGDVVRDLSLNGNHGTLHNFAFPPTVASGWNPGRRGVGLNYDGVDDYVRIPDSESLSPTSAMTAMVWVKGVAQIGRGVFTKHDFDVNQISYSIFVDNTLLKVYISDDGTGSDLHRKQYTSSITGFDNTWHLIGFTFDAGTLKLFVDGVEDTNTTKNQDAAITTIHDSTADVMVGCYLNNDTPTDLFNGSIDQPHIVAGAWTPKQCMDYAINPWQVYLDE